MTPVSQRTGLVVRSFRGREERERKSASEGSAEESDGPDGTVVGQSLAQSEMNGSDRASRGAKSRSQTGDGRRGEKHRSDPDALSCPQRLSLPQMALLVALLAVGRLRDAGTHVPPSHPCCQCGSHPPAV